MTEGKNIFSRFSRMLAVLLMAIPLGFRDDKKVCKEVRQELRERPRYWEWAIAVYWAVIVVIVVTMNIASEGLRYYGRINIPAPHEPCYPCYCTVSQRLFLPEKEPLYSRHDPDVKDTFPSA